MISKEKCDEVFGQFDAVYNELIKNSALSQDDRDGLAEEVYESINLFKSVYPFLLALREAIHAYQSDPKPDVFIDALTSLGVVKGKDVQEDCSLYQFDETLTKLVASLIIDGQEGGLTGVQVKELSGKLCIALSGYREHHLKPAEEELEDILSGKEVNIEPCKNAIMQCVALCEQVEQDVKQPIGKTTSTNNTPQASSQTPAEEEVITPERIKQVLATKVFRQPLKHIEEVRQDLQEEEEEVQVASPINTPEADTQMVDQIEDVLASSDASIEEQKTAIARVIKLSKEKGLEYDMVAEKETATGKLVTYLPPKMEDTPDNRKTHAIIYHLDQDNNLLRVDYPESARVSILIPPSEDKRGGMIRFNPEKEVQKIGERAQDVECHKIEEPSKAQLPKTHVTRANLVGGHMHGKVPCQGHSCSAVPAAA